MGCHKAYLLDTHPKIKEVDRVNLLGEELRNPTLQIRNSVMSQTTLFAQERMTPTKAMHLNYKVIRNNCTLTQLL